ncbi:Gap-Pol polyprotein [Schistosoma japonicum]|uniref:Gap-Pol polyprotein n=1 Tax=Schistosoma japonicum TaxID=6182 RepID=A0A4Z2DC79_SCHJA|nr:Gap-Pol polyprotein [Schistosoma japonicum]
MAQRFEDPAMTTASPALFGLHDFQRPASRGGGNSLNAVQPTKRSCYHCKRLGKFVVKCGHNRQIQTGLVKGMKTIVLINTRVSTSQVRRLFMPDIGVPLEPAAQGHNLVTQDGTVIPAEIPTTLTM